MLNELSKKKLMEMMLNELRFNLTLQKKTICEMLAEGGISYDDVTALSLIDIGISTLIDLDCPKDKIKKILLEKISEVDAMAQSENWRNN